MTQPMSGTTLLGNQFVQFAPGTCPSCRSVVSLVASPSERVARWACARCRTTGMAPWVPADRLEAEAAEVVQNFASA